MYGKLLQALRQQFTSPYVFYDKVFSIFGHWLSVWRTQVIIDDHIVDYFKDKLPQNGAYDYMKMLTIRDMLTMRTCHDSTTYKTAGITD